MRRDLGERWKRLRARVGALVFDALLIAYALWCISFLQDQGGAIALLSRYPGLVLTTPFLAAIWQASGTSLGQRAYRVRLLDSNGKAAPLGHRVAYAFGTAATCVVVLYPLKHLERAEGAAWVSLGVALGLAVALLLGGRSAGEALSRARFSIQRTEDTGPVTPWYRRSNPWIVLGLLALTFQVGVEITSFSLGALFEGAGRAGDMWKNLLRPDWSITGNVLEKLVETVFLALMASTLALPFAFLISFFGARNLMSGSAGGRVVYAITRVFMNATRSIEPLVWAVIFVLWVGAGPFAGMLALFVHSVAALGKLYSEAIESIDPGPVEAIHATGASFVQVLRFGVVPQVIPPFLSFTVYRWDINVRMATILGLIGGGGIGDLLLDYNQLGAWSKVGTIIVFITLVVWIMDILSAKARERLA